MRLFLSVLTGLILFSHAAFGAPPIGNPIISQQTSVSSGSFKPTTTYNILNGFSATSGASAGYILIFDAAAVPGDGTVTPKYCYSIGATSSVAVSWVGNPAPFTNGIILVFSTTGCFTKTISNTAFFSAQVQ